MSLSDVEYHRRKYLLLITKDPANCPEIKDLYDNHYEECDTMVQSLLSMAFETDSVDEEPHDADPAILKEIEDESDEGMKRELRAHPKEAYHRQYKDVTYTISRNREGGPWFDPWLVTIDVPPTSAFRDPSTGFECPATVLVCDRVKGIIKVCTWPRGGVMFGNVKIRGFDHAEKLARTLIDRMTALGELEHHVSK